MNIEALMKVTVSNGYTAAEEATAQAKLSNVSAYEKETALFPEESHDNLYIPIDQHDTLAMKVLRSVANAAIWATEERR